MTFLSTPDTLSFPTEIELQDPASEQRVSRPTANGRRQMTVAGVMAYTALWGLCFGLFHLAAKLTQGVHTIAANRLSSMLMLIATGLLFVAIGLPITILAGRSRQVVPVVFGCFFVGLLAIPILLVTLAALAGLGVIELD